MKDLRGKKAVAASLSLTLALGGVPAVAFADADNGTDGDASEQSVGQTLVVSANGGSFQNGTDVLNLTANEDGSYDEPAAPSRDGFTFKGWYTTSSLDGYPEGYENYFKFSFSNPSAATTVFALWDEASEPEKPEVKTFDVNYVANGGVFADGNDLMQASTDSNGIMRQPAAPTRDGYTFKGWYWVSAQGSMTDEQLEGQRVDFDNPISNDANIFALWDENVEENEYNVLYAANGGQFATGETFQQGMTDSDGIMRQPAAPTREGYTFAGWYWCSDISSLTDEQKESQKVDFTVPTKGDTTIFAQWVENKEETNEYNVLYAANGGQFATGETFQQGVTDSDGIMREPAAPTREGYTFAGWYWHADLSQMTDEQKAAEKVDFTQPIQSNVNIFAQWTKNEDQANEYTVVYDANGGQFATGETFQQGVTDSDGIMREPLAPTRDGYTFEGWYKQPDLSSYTDEEKEAEKVDFTVPVTSDTAIYAQWTKNEEQANLYNVMYVANGGQFSTGETFQQGVTDSDGIMREPAAPTRDGYTFKGWYWVSAQGPLTDEQFEGQKVDFTQPINGNANIFAQWTKNEEPAATQFEINYVANGGAFADGSEIFSDSADADGYVNEPAEPTRDGYTFKGWYWVSDRGSLTDEQFEAQKVDFTQPLKGNANVFAQWTKSEEPAATELHVNYVANGGVFADGNPTMDGVADSNGLMREPAAPTRDGYTFEGWYWHADLSQLTDEQKELEKVDFTQPIQSNVNIYAQWTKNETPAEKITVKFVDNFNKTSNEVEIDKGATVAKPADPTYDGYTFEGWSSTLGDDQKQYTPVDFTQAVEDADGDGVVTYYAFYVKNAEPDNGTTDNNGAADNNGTDNASNAADEQSEDQSGTDASSDEQSNSPQTGDATNVAAVAGVGGVAGLLAAAAALLRRRRNN